MSAESFRDALAGHGLNPPSIVADGRIHRFSASEHKRDDAGWYVFHGDYGAFGDHRRGIKEGWSNLKGKKPADRQKFDAEIKKAKAKIAADEKKRWAECARRAKYIWDASTELLEHPYVSKKKIIPYAARAYKGFIALPLYNDGEMQSLQLISETRKRFLKGTKKQGGYLVLGEITDKYLICEGYATGCTLHEATGIPIVIAWDAYNLAPVVKAFKKMYPDAKVMVAGDNDSNKSENIGAKYAEASGVPVRLPPIAGDWNDYGVEGTRQAFEQPDESQEHYAESIDSPPFRVLGYDKTHTYYLPHGKNQIVALTPAGHTLNNLISLAPTGYWVGKYGDVISNKVAIATAINDLMRQAEQKGIFTPENRVRGVGAWVDDGRHVLHCGDKVYVDGEPKVPYDVAGDFIYEQCQHVTTLHPKPLKNAEANALRDLCERLPWFNPLSGSLLAGWCVVAPVCAMLPWRPHIWITGEAQSGKTVILRDVVLPMAGNMALRVDGGTTEAAIRQTLMHDARPVIYDEAEAESKKDQGIMEGVLMLARKSSSGSRMIKGSSSGESMSFTVRSAFCFSGINPSVKQRADETRISFLHLIKDTDKNKNERYLKWQQQRAEVMTKDYADRMLARTVANLSTLVENCQTFVSAAAMVLNDRRAADQVAPMLAGLYLLSSTSKISLENAKKWIEKYDWTQHTATAEATDHEMFITYIATKTLRVFKNSVLQDVAIGKLINCAAGFEGDVNQKTADEELRRIGIRVKNNRVYIANKSPELSKLLAGQAWQSNWRRVLGDIEGAINEGVVRFFEGFRDRAVSIPISIFAHDVREEGELL